MKFRCKLSQCVYEFTSEYDIKAMKAHPEYDEVPDNAEATAAQIQEEAKKPAKASKTA